MALEVTRRPSALHPLGGAELRAFAERTADHPETEFSHKLYWQATHRPVGTGPETTAFLAGFFT